MCLSSLETQSILCKVTCHIKEVLIAFAGVVNLNRKSFHHQVLFYLILGILLSILCHVEQIKVWTLQELRMLCPRHNVNVNIVVLNCQKCNQCLKCQVSGHKSLRISQVSQYALFFENLKKSETFPCVIIFFFNIFLSLICKVAEGLPGGRLIFKAEQFARFTLKFWN